MTLEMQDRTTRIITAIRGNRLYKQIEMVFMLLCPLNVSREMGHSLPVQIIFGYLYLVSNGLVQAVLNRTSVMSVVLKFDNLEFAISAALVYFSSLPDWRFVIQLCPVVVFICAVMDVFCRFGSLMRKSKSEKLAHAISRLGSEFTVFFFSNRQKAIKINKVSRIIVLIIIGNHCSYLVGAILATFVEAASEILKIVSGQNLYDHAAAFLIRYVETMRHTFSK